MVAYLVGTGITDVDDIVPLLRQEQCRHRGAKATGKAAPLSVQLDLLVVLGGDAHPVRPDGRIGQAAFAQIGKPLLRPLAECIDHGCTGYLALVQTTHSVADHGKGHPAQRRRHHTGVKAILIGSLGGPDICGCGDDEIHCYTSSLGKNSASQRSLNSKSSLPRRILVPCWIGTSVLGWIILPST